MLSLAALLGGDSRGQVVEGGQSLHGPASIDDSLDGPTVAWLQPENPGGAKVVAHSRVREGRPGQSLGVEHLRFVCPAGYSGVFLYPLGRAPVVQDFRASVRLRSSGYGVKLAARVVLPGRDGEAGAGKTLVVRGDDVYQTPGQWAELALENLPRLVRNQVRLMLAGAGAAGGTGFDERNAYVDSLVLIVPGGPRGADFWVDRVRVHGPVLRAHAGGSEGNDAAGSDGRGDPTRVHATAAGLVVGQRVTFPRVWQWRGEPFALVAAAGFDTVALDQPADAAILAQARDHRLRLICPPPGSRSGAEDTPPVEVLAWRLPDGLDATAIDTTRPAIDRIRDDPRLSLRPLVSAPADGIAAWSRLSDALVLGAMSHGTEPSAAFAQRWSLAQPGTPALARISLTLPDMAAQQLVAFSPNGKAPRWREPDAIRRDVWSAIGAGASGVWFDAARPLGGALPEDRVANATLELLHRKLKLIEPWLAGGGRGGVVKDAGGRPLGAIFTRDRTRLIVGIGRGEAVASDSSAPARGFVVPGVAETAAAYSFTPAGLAPIKRRRVLGGVHLDTPAPHYGQMLLVTDDRFAHRDIQRRAERAAADALALQQELAIGRLRRFESMMDGMAGEGVAKPFDGVASSAKRLISRSKAAEASRDLVGAYLNAERAEAVLRRAAQELRQQVTPGDRLDSSPLAAFSKTWPDELRLRQLLGALPRRGNRLAGGDFEDLAELREQGWRYTKLEGRQATVGLTGDQPKHGEKCLAMGVAAEAARPGEAVAWITSPPTDLEAGQLVEVTGWARFEPHTSEAGEAVPGNLVIVDSLGGEALGLAIRADEPGAWRPFRLLRRAPTSGPVRVSFVLHGAGRASIDAVMLRPVSLSQPTLHAAAAGSPPTAQPK